jgi:hypothetical protein
MTEQELSALTIAIGVLKRESMFENAEILKSLRTRLSLESRVLAERKEPMCEDCGDGIVPHNPGVCGTCYAMKYAHPTPDDAGQWIGVNDRLPEEETEVLVTGPAWNKDDYSKGRYFSLGTLQEGVWKGEDGGDLHSPSHWMPLPNPPAIDRAMQDKEKSNGNG